METICGFCSGTGYVTCPGCGGKGYTGRLTANMDFDMSPCAVCGGRKRIQCSVCHGKGTITVPDAPGGTVPSKFELLTEMFQLQTEVSNYMMGAQGAKSSSDFIEAKENFRKKIEFGQKHLDLALLHNKHYLPPVEIEPIVRVMTDALLMLSDILQSMNELNEANRCRDKAVRLAESYLSSGARLEIQRSLAASYITQGRFNEALSLLYLCRDALIESGDTVFMIRVTIDIVDILNWLGDYRKSLNELNKASIALSSLTGQGKPSQEDINEAVIRAAADIFAGKNSGKGAVDAGSVFMIQYHKHRLAGNRPMRAMQLTQKYMLEMSVHDPYKWVGFTLYGCQ